ncbi:hypothetical protein SAMN05421737_11286 [Shouchella lonarensis]|uniref:Uncharacterized protein n=1 Tax=Shouchella lonarensis TaxID=1464122 RepID=A0A1G6NJ18_9BACI|nr:hypothetical protein SAMN05421737_11286 [Shouchella lonarensis]
MMRIDYKQLGENLYHEKLENGLNVFLPKEDFHEALATLTTK